MAKFDFIDLGGGRNGGQAATGITDSEMAELVNFYPFNTKLVRRDGVTRLTANAYAENPTSVMALREETGVWTVIVGTRTSLARLDGNALVPLTSASGPSSFSDLQDPWDFHQYSNTGYALRKGVGLKRFGRDFFGDAGIAAPAAAPVITEGAAGSAEAGDYYPVYTYANFTTGTESLPSPVGAKLTKAASKKFNWATLVPSSNGQVNAMRLYRTAPIGAGGVPGEFFFCIEIQDNFHTTFTGEDVIVNDLGDPVSFNNGLPPAGLLYGDLWLERLMATDGTDGFFSEEGLIECWASDSVIEVFKDDGHQIRAVRGFGDRCLFGKTNKVHYVVPTGVRKFQRFTLSDRHGMWSHASCKIAEGHAFWYGGNSFFRSSGTDVVDIGDPKIVDLLKRIPDASKQFVSAEIYEPLSQYIATVPLDVAGNNKLVLVHNYKTGKWTTYDHPTDAPSFLAEMFDQNYGKQIYATFYDGHLYQYLLGNTDWGNAINARLKTKRFQLTRGLLKALHRIWLLATTVSKPITIKLYRDGSSVAHKSRTVMLDEGADWKIYSLSNAKQKAVTLQIGIEYTGSDPIELDEMALEVAEFMQKRRAA